MSNDAPVARAGGDEASFTGERFLPQCSGEIAYEHWHRYAFARPLAAGKTVLDVASGEGYVVLASPNRAEYSDARETRNEFHVRELYRDELTRLLARHFVATRWFRQRVQCWSGIWSDSPAAAPIEALSIDGLSVDPYGS